MAGYNNRSRYQYETSPRKLEPEYRPIKKKYPKKSTAKKKNVKKVQQHEKNKAKLHLQAQTKAIIYVGLLFAILFAISYRNTVISEKYSQIKEMKENLATIEKENEQIEVNIESKTNLGIKKLDEDQTIYVNLDKQDYIESASDDVIMEDNQNIFQKIIKKIQTLFKQSA